MWFVKFPGRGAAFNLAGEIVSDRAILLADAIKRADYILINKEFVVRPLPLPRP